MFPSLALLRFDKIIIAQAISDLVAIGKSVNSELRIMKDAP
jgi:hypothetical protein